MRHVGCCAVWGGCPDNVGRELARAGSDRLKVIWGNERFARARSCWRQKRPGAAFRRKHRDGLEDGIEHRRGPLRHRGHGSGGSAPSRSLYPELSVGMLFLHMALQDLGQRKQGFARKACSAEIVSLDQLAEQSDDALLPCVRSEIGQPEEEAIRQEECETLAEAIRALPRLDSSVLWMREALNLSYAEIADNLGCSVESVRSRLWRARRRLRENMALLIPEHVPQ